VVSAYPVLMKAADFVLIFFTVMIIGFLAAVYPVYNIRKVDTTMVRTE
jgi:ABC-type antimicrobial peptide transport system permease subunit